MTGFSLLSILDAERLDSLDLPLPQLRHDGCYQAFDHRVQRFVRDCTAGKKDGVRRNRAGWQLICPWKYAGGTILDHSQHPVIREGQLAPGTESLLGRFGPGAGLATVRQVILLALPPAARPAVVRKQRR